MAKRGRKSDAEASVALLAGAEVLTHPEPPYDLWRDEEQAVWRQIVEDVPADGFTGRNLALLTEYCTAVVSCRRLVEVGERLKSPKTISNAAGDTLWD